MEKQQNMGSCEDSMTTVTMKDYTPGLEYPDPPPSYRTTGGKGSQLVQVTRIVAVAAVTIAGMLSFALVFSAWLSTPNNNNNPSNCQYLQAGSLEALLQPASLRSGLPESGDDLDSAESKLESSKKKEDGKSSEEPESGEDSAITMLRLPLELNLHEHMFEKNQRSHMNCVIEKKKAEEIVDEQSKPLPPLLGLLNMSTDPRYLHFTGEKMAISCDSGNDHRQVPPTQHQQAPPPAFHPGFFMDLLHGHPPPHAPSPPQPHPFLSLSSSDSASVPLQIIGPIPLPAHSGVELLQHQSGPSGPQMIPLLVPDTPQHSNGLSIEDFGPIFFGNGGGQGPQGQVQFQIPPQPFNIHRQARGQSFPPQAPPPHPFSVQSSEIRERALHHPVPIVPRHHIQHIIRPRSVEPAEKSEKRLKRCACDCACKNHSD